MCFLHSFLHSSFVLFVNFVVNLFSSYVLCIKKVLIYVRENGQGTPEVQDDMYIILNVKKNRNPVPVNGF